MTSKVRGDELARAVRDSSKVVDCPHDIYRYPARFSPLFVRKAVELFSEPGDTILDPFCGGGTTIVEAVQLGRRAVGLDVSSLAAFISRTKTTPLSRRDKDAILNWLKRLRIRPSSASPRGASNVGRSDYLPRNLPIDAEAFFGQVIRSIQHLHRRQRDYIRLVLLSTGQWALDCKTRQPSMNEMLVFFKRNLSTSLARFSAFMQNAALSTGISSYGLAANRRVICRSAEYCDLDLRIPKSWQPIRLVITSPPYPGVHVLYHRWQVNGRRETAAPFWIANQNDGAGESYYTLGQRRELMLTRYYNRLEVIFESVRKLVHPDAYILQLVAFSDPSWQLPKYLRSMTVAGFQEVFLCKEHSNRNRIWRHVPNRRWYAMAQRTHCASREILLVHRPI
jgi:DNA modification methylase